MKRTAALLLLASLIPAVSFADTVNLAGNTIGAPTFNRPTESGSASLFTVSYNVYQFSVATSGQFTFSLTAADPSSYDTFLHLFVGAFDPLNSSATFLAGNDDRDINDPNLGSGLSNVSLIAGTTCFFVLDGFGGADAGPYSASISGPGAINAVPEPSPLALLGGGVLGLVALMRWRRWQRNS